MLGCVGGCDVMGVAVLANGKGLVKDVEWFTGV